MKAFQINTQTNNVGNLELNYPLHSKNIKVKVIVLVEEEFDELFDDDRMWLKAASKNPVFDFLHDEEDVYTIEDGEEFN